MYSKKKIKEAVFAIIDLWERGEKGQAVKNLMIIKFAIPANTFNFLADKMIETDARKVTWLMEQALCIIGGSCETEDGKIFYEGTKVEAKESCGSGNSERYSRLFDREVRNDGMA
jgi:hypothetical protein